MCYPANCPRCAKTTWGGCGQHADEVMGSVPPAQRCNCAHSTENPRTNR